MNRFPHERGDECMDPTISGVELSVVTREACSLGIAAVGPAIHRRPSPSHTPVTSKVRLHCSRDIELQRELVTAFVLDTAYPGPIDISAEEIRTNARFWI